MADEEMPNKLVHNMQEWYARMEAEQQRVAVNKRRVVEPKTTNGTHDRRK